MTSSEIVARMCMLLLARDVCQCPDSCRFGKPLVSWTIIEIQGERSFCELFTALQAGFFDCVPVTDALKKAYNDESVIMY